MTQAQFNRRRFWANVAGWTLAYLFVIALILDAAR